jgi:branched-chain amino acid transport system ATP-binding protein
MLLEATGLNVRYGRVAAVSDVDISVAEGQVVAVLGANGAGKSSLLKALLGMVRPVSGSIQFAGRSITQCSVSERVKAGLALVPEGRRILITLTVEENLLLGAYHRRDKAAVAGELDGIYQRFPNLAERRYAKAACLSGGEQQMLAIGRALLGAPRLMMLDEPSLGLSPLFIGRLFELLRELNRNGLAVLLVEQNTGMALEIAHQCLVLELGHEIIRGTPAQLKQDKKLQEAYLGG